MKRIILDTNFLLAISQFKVDIFSELKRICDFPYETCILDKTIDELEKIASTPGHKGKMHAKLALLIIGGKLKVLNTGPGHTDDLLAQMADEDNIIATQDQELKRKIKSRIITIKQKKYLIFLKC